MSQSTQVQHQPFRGPQVVQRQEMKLCFRCNRPGHIQRYCRNQSRSPSESTRNNRSQSHQSQFRPQVSEYSDEPADPED